MEWDMALEGGYCSGCYPTLKAALERGDIRRAILYSHKSLFVKPNYLIDIEFINL